MEYLKDIMMKSTSETLIICIHEVASRADGSLPFVVGRDLLEATITRLTRAEWQLSSLEHAERAGHRSLVLTLDDGRAGAVEWLLSSDVVRGTPATIFPAPIFIEQPDLIPDVERYSAFSSYERLHDAVRVGHAIGSHGVTHRRLPDLSDEELKSELSDSRHRLEDRFGQLIDRLALPYGRSSHKVIRYARQHGYTKIMTTQRGCNTAAEFDAGVLLRFGMRSDRQDLGLPPGVFETSGNGPYCS